MDENRIEDIKQTEEEKALMAKLFSKDKIVLATKDYSQAERELYEYAGYYMLPESYHKQKNLDIYVNASNEIDVYGHGKRIFPGTLTIYHKVDMSSAIVFNRHKKTVTTGSCRMDMELMRIIERRCKELGFPFYTDRTHKSREEKIIETAIEITWELREYWDEGCLKCIPYEQLKETITSLAVQFESLHENTDWLECNYSEEILCFARKGIAKELWGRFGDVPIDQETKGLEKGWNGFQKGTPQEDIWHWFERTFHIDVTKDLMGR